MIDSGVKEIVDGLIVIANMINGCRVLCMWIVDVSMQ